MKKVAKRKAKKKVTKRTAKRGSKRSNPDGSVRLPLTNEEIATLGWLRSRYESARILLDAYDEDNKTWDLKIVTQAYIATKEDGGDLGTVPNTGDELQDKIYTLFGMALKRPLPLIKRNKRF
jgi:hypothetical protein